MNDRAVSNRMARGITAAGEEFYRRLQLALFLRVIMVTFLLGATVFIHLTRDPSLLTQPLVALYVVSGLTYFVTLISLVGMRSLRRFASFSYAQILWDVAFVSSLIYITGGAHSIFSFLYLLAIIMGGTVQYRKGAFLAAVAGSISYGIIAAGLEFRVVPYLIEVEFFSWPELVYNFFINLAAMFGTAVLSSYLTEKLRITGVELTETRRDRDALEVLNENIIRSLASGLVTLDRNGEITSFNRAASTISGIKPAQAIGKKLEGLFAPAQVILGPSPDGPLPDTGRKEVTWTPAKGTPRHLEFRLSPLLDSDGKHHGSLVIFNDVTELREMEEKLRKSDRLAAVGQLAAGIAHEIRNPLASISGSIEMLDQGLELDDTSSRLMRIVLRETNRLNSLITDFLLFARPGPRSVSEFPLKRLIDEIIEVFVHRPDLSTSIQWKIKISDELMMETDTKLLQQIFWNLLNNAVEAMKGQGTISIRAQQKAAPGSDDMVEIEVEDNGPGIPEEIRNKIFDPFFTTRERGTGLGLSVVFRIVESLDGSVGVEEAAGGGAKFVIWLPRQLRTQGVGSVESDRAAGVAGM